MFELDRNVFPVAFSTSIRRIEITTGERVIKHVKITKDSIEADV